MRECVSESALLAAHRGAARRGRTGERRVSGRVTGGDARHRRRGMRGVVTGRGCLSAVASATCVLSTWTYRRKWRRRRIFREPPRGGSAASAARWLRRTRPNAERRCLDTGGRPGTRVIRRGYSSIRRSEPEADLRMRGWGWICIRPSRDSDANSGPFAERHRMRLSRRSIGEGGYPPDHPREVKPRRKANDRVSQKQRGLPAITRGQTSSVSNS
jgi:hypothetical protein